MGLCQDSPLDACALHCLRTLAGEELQLSPQNGGTNVIQLIEAKRNQGASSEVVRDINRRIVLNLVRTRQPISRADLARASGLQRSTISLIGEQLIEEN